MKRYLLLTLVWLAMAVWMGYGQPAAPAFTVHAQATSTDGSTICPAGQKFVAGYTTGGSTIPPQCVTNTGVGINLAQGDCPTNYYKSIADKKCYNKEGTQVIDPANPGSAQNPPPGGTGGTTTPTPNQDCDPTSANYGQCESEHICSAKKKDGYVLIKAFGNDTVKDPSGKDITGYGRCVNLTDFVQTLLNYILSFSAIIAGIMLLRGGFGVLVSRGTPAAVADARSMLTNAVIGLILIAVAFVLIKFLNTAFSSVNNAINLNGPFTQ